MKQIKFGSFPLCEISNDDRKCLDRYLLKHFSDQMAYSNTMNNLNIVKNNIYISPTSLLKGFASKSKKDAEFESNTGYIEVMKRAFLVLKDFYLKLSNATFYKDNIFYPIYIEKIENVKNIEEIKYEYNFILLTDGLFKDIDRMHVDESAIINAMYLYIQLFHPGLFLDKNLTYKVQPETGISSLSKENLIYITRFYKLIVKYSLNPVNLFLGIYDLINQANEILANDVTNNKIPNHESQINSQAQDVASRVNYSKASGLINNQKLRLNLKKVVQKMAEVSKRLQFSANAQSAGDVRKSYQHAQIITEAMEEILNQKEIYDFVDNLSLNRRSREARIQAVADYHEYNNIISVLEKLVAFNNIGLNNIIKDTDIDFDKDITLSKDDNDTSIYFKLEGAINKDFFDNQYYKFLKHSRNFFKTMAGGIYRQHFENVSKKILEQERKDSPLYKLYEDFNTQKSNLVLHLDDTKAKLADIQNQLNTMTAQAQNLDNSEINVLRELQNQYDSLSREAMDISNNISNIDAQLLDIGSKLEGFDKFKSNISNPNYTGPKPTDNFAAFSDTLQVNGKSINYGNGIGQNKLVDAIMDKDNVDNLDDSFKFIFEDLSHIFLSPVILAEMFKDNGTFSVRNIPASANDLTRLLQEARMHPNSDNILIREYAQLENDVDNLCETMLFTLNDVVSNFRDKFRGNARFPVQLNPNMNTVTTSDDNYLDVLTSEPEVDPEAKAKLKAKIISYLAMDIFRPFKQMLQRIKMDSESSVHYSQKLSILHPILGKLAKNIKNFKIFIFNTKVLSTLYNLIFITREKMFLSGMLNKPPRKISNVELQARFVLNNALGLQENPVWILGGGKIRLQLPDYLSLTEEKLESEIPASELKSICALDPKKYWKEANIGNLFKEDTSREAKINSINDSITQFQNKANKAKTDGLEKPDNARIYKLAKDEINKLEKMKEEIILTTTSGNIGLHMTKSSNNYDEFKRRFKIDFDDLANEESFFDQIKQVPQPAPMQMQRQAPTAFQQQQTAPIAPRAISGYPSFM